MSSSTLGSALAGSVAGSVSDVAAMKAQYWHPAGDHLGRRELALGVDRDPHLVAVAGRVEEGGALRPADAHVAGQHHHRGRSKGWLEQNLIPIDEYVVH